MVKFMFVLVTLITLAGAYTFTALHEATMSYNRINSTRMVQVEANAK